MPPYRATFTTVDLNMKWGARFAAENYTVFVTTAELEPSATIDARGRGRESGQPGTPTIWGAGASHATAGGSCMLT